MNVWKSLAGQVEMEITAAEPGRLISEINNAGIVLNRLRQESELSFRFFVCRKDCKEMRSVCDKRGAELRILHRDGLFWMLRRLEKRPVLTLGMAVWVLILLYLPSRVLFVQVEGNTVIPKRQILDAAERCGIRFGASRREVRSEKVKNALLGEVPQLQWAGVNTTGCLAVISVREGAAEEKKAEEMEVSNVVASRDGYILSGEVTQGNGLFQPGQSVKQGQILISGYTDCGICIRATRSQGEIFAQTQREMEAVTTLSCLQRCKEEGYGRKISLVFRKKRIILWKDSGISDATCGRMYEEYYITLPGGFRLPLTLCIETEICYDTESAECAQDETEGALLQFADQYLRSQMIAGEIRQSTAAVTMQNGVSILKGVYTCVEMIGREQRAQIGDINGKDS